MWVWLAGMSPHHNRAALTLACTLHGSSYYYYCWWWWHWHRIIPGTCGVPWSLLLSLCWSTLKLPGANKATSPHSLTPQVWTMQEISPCLGDLQSKFSTHSISSCGCWRRQTNTPAATHMQISHHKMVQKEQGNPGVGEKCKLLVMVEILRGFGARGAEDVDSRTTATRTGLHSSTWIGREHERDVRTESHSTPITFWGST